MMIFALVLLPYFGADALKHSENRPRIWQDLAPIIVLAGVAVQASAILLPRPVYDSRIGSDIRSRGGT